ncbi:MAG: hypothetical protein L0H53_02340 [Candidatus Nitrosocosmicus sp.]|nr:hypothetical protein [Candidatus Nitrosocosmicus sp.]
MQIPILTLVHWEKGVLLFEMKLRALQYLQEELSPESAGKLNNAESNYNSIYSGIFGSLPLKEAKAPESSVLEEKVVADKPQEQDGQEPGKVIEDKPRQK